MCHPTPPPPLSQRLRQMRAADGLPFQQLLPEAEVRPVLDDLPYSWRDRLFNPFVTLWAFVSQVFDADGSCRQAVARVHAQRLGRGEPVGSPDPSSYAQARQRLPPELPRRLARQTAQAVRDAAPAAWHWRGRRVVIADGSVLHLADTPANQAAYPQPKSQPPGLGFPLMRLVAFFCWASGVVLDLAYGPHDGQANGELSLFRRLLDALSPGDVLLADRNFDSYRDLATLARRGVHAVLRANASRRLLGRAGVGDWAEVWSRPSFQPSRLSRAEHDALPEFLEVRLVRYPVTQAGFRTRLVTLVTTLLDALADPPEALAALYRERWQCELNLRWLKQTLRLDALRCRTPAMVEKELWLKVLGYNLLRRVMGEAAVRAGVPARRLSFTGALQAVRALVECGTSGVVSAAVWWRELYRQIGHHRIGNRRDRVEPRKVKKRRAKYSHLTRPRDEERKAS